MYATTTTGHREHISSNRSTKVLQQLISLGYLVGVVVQDTITTTEEWNGLSYSDAQSLQQSSETSTLNGVTRQYLGGAKFAQSGIGGASIRVPSCWGTSITTTFDRMGETNLYHVTKTTTTYTVRGYGGPVLTLE